MRALHTIHTLTIRMMLVVTFLLLPTAAVSAQTVTVGCAGAAGTFNYTSLGAALAALQPNEAQYQEVIVSGTCTEAVEIGAFADLAITGTPGATITNPGNLAIGSAAKILELRNLTIGPSSLGVFVRGAGVVIITDCVIRENGNGVEVFPQGEAAITSTVIEDNQHTGIGVRPGGSLFLNGLNTIRHNEVGITAEGGTAWIAWANEISNNTFGIRLRNGSSATVVGALLLADNQFGIVLTNSSVTLNRQDGSPILRGNGVVGDSNTAAIIAEGNSHVDLFDGQVINNHSHGVVLRDNSSLRTANDTITGNAGSGIRLLSLSTAHIYGGMKISGNSGGDLACSLNSFTTGYRSGIAKMACLTFTPSTEPPLY